MCIWICARVLLSYIFTFPKESTKLTERISNTHGSFSILSLFLSHSLFRLRYACDYFCYTNCLSITENILSWEFPFFFESGNYRFCIVTFMMINFYWKRWRFDALNICVQEKFHTGNITLLFRYFLIISLSVFPFFVFNHSHSTQSRSKMRKCENDKRRYWIYVYTTNIYIVGVSQFPEECWCGSAHTVKSYIFCTMTTHF